MSKIYGLFGAMSGKVADVVMTTKNGVQIVRKYQPNVFNPNTPAQIQARAKLKLLSQLSAVMAPYIAIPKEGIVSSRNLFTRKNYGSLSYSNNEAQVTMAALKLTDSVVGLGSITTTRTESSVSVRFNATGAFGEGELSRMVYVAFIESGENEIRALGSVVVTEPGASNSWPADIAAPSTGVVYVYAYGIRDNTEAAKVVFSNLEVITADAIAKIIVSRRLSAADVTLTDTRYSLAPVPTQS